MKKTKHILVIRFSAMGDVALTIPALLSVVEAHPELTITFVSRPFYASFIPAHPRIKSVGIDVDKYKGVFRLRKLAQELMKEHKFDAVVDLHSVLRSRVITSFMRFKGKIVTTLHKKRNEKKSIINHRSTQQLPHIIEQYLNVFRLAGLESPLISGPWIKPEEKKELSNFISQNNLKEKKEKWIGIAPFAAHTAKMWGIDNIKNLIAGLTQIGHTVFLFGGGKSELEQLSLLEDKGNNVYSAAGKIKFDQELALMKKLDCLVCMDSSNMHFASLIGTPVISIWGATTPLIGFFPYHNEHIMVQVPEKSRKNLTLSSYGNKESKNGFNWKEEITVEEVLEFVSLV